MPLKAFEHTAAELISIAYVEDEAIATVLHSIMREACQAILLGAYEPSNLYVLKLTNVAFLDRLWEN